MELRRRRIKGGVASEPERPALAADAPFDEDEQPADEQPLAEAGAKRPAPKLAVSAIASAAADDEQGEEGEEQQGDGDGVDADDVDDDEPLHATTTPLGPEHFASAFPAPAEPDWLDRFEHWVPLALTLICGFTRFYRLDCPPGVVFDEYHFGRFTNQYSNKEFLFDIHPPLGKLVFYWVSRLVNYDHTVCQYEGIQDAYDPACKFIFLRATAALFGTLTAPLLYGILRGWGGSVRAGILGVCFYMFDNLNLGEARLILIDSQLFFWLAMALFTAQRWWARQNEASLAADAFKARTGAEYDSSKYAQAADPRLMTLTERALWVVAVGATCSSAISIKFTGLATPAMIGLESLMAVSFLRRAVSWPELVGVLATAFPLYVHHFWWHFHLGQKSADGDGFMLPEFQRTVWNNSAYDPAAVRPPWFENFFYLNAEMVRANARIDQRHNWDSVWWEWPLNLRGILYYSLEKKHGHSELVYLLGNPAVIWLVLAGVVTSVLVGLVYLRARTRPPCDYAGFGPFFVRQMYCLATFVFNLLPYVLVTRSCFIYHYMPALMYGEIMTALLVDKLAGRKFMPLACKVILAVVLAVWLHFAPWVYAIRE